MGVGKWIGGFFGFMSGGPLGALAGYALGWLFDKGAEGLSGDSAFNADGTYRNNWDEHNGYGNNHRNNGYSAQQQYEGHATRSSSRCLYLPHTSSRQTER